MNSEIVSHGLVLPAICGREFALIADYCPSWGGVGLRREAGRCSAQLCLDLGPTTLRLVASDLTTGCFTDGPGLF